MAQDRVMFIPWNSGDIGVFHNGLDEFAYGADYNNQVQGETHQKREWTTVHMDSPGQPLSDLGFGFGTRLMIIGHGGMGDPNLYPPHGSGAAPVSCKDIVAGLQAQGLNKRYLGTITANCCYSALGDPPFAKLLARELFSQGYKATCVLGYKGSLQGAYVDDDIPGSAGKYRHRVVTTADGPVKSKHAQERFFGFC